MATLNKVMLLGNLTRDPELKYTPSGTAVAELGLAVNRKFKQGDDWKEEVCFVDVTVWSRSAENCAEYLKKGSQALIEGRLQFANLELRTDILQHVLLDVLYDCRVNVPRCSGKIC